MINRTKIKNVVQKSQISRNFYNSYLKSKIYLYFKLLNLENIKDIALDVLGIEFTSICDLKCKWCSLDNSRAKGFMEPKLFKKILDDISQSDIKIKHITLHHAGETLLHPKFREMLEILGEKKKNTPNFPYISLLTNATTLDDNKINAILETNSIDWMRFSIDGGNKKDFEAIRRGAKWENVLSNVNKFLDKNKKTGKNIKTSILCLMTNPSKQVSEEFKKLLEKVDEYRINPPHNWDGSKNLGLKSKSIKGGCWRALKSMAILWDGRVVPCCADLNGRGIIGDLKTQKLYKVYLGKERLEILNKMKNNQRSKIELCKNCSNF